ncbi:helix-turn-helix domain-containing protein [Streptomyces sp. NBC_00239]|uniref:helix-turn-helix domain-containing protein n=1 Tax=Streptomyces sp. NBC_00239 TaxID=2903640 RepID=UPI002E2D19B6|nr:helix-turn-helix domain-containing protein [Streptomyces sp. NBC_00239]
MSKSTNSCASDAAPAVSGKAPSVKPGQRLTGERAERFGAYVVSLYSEPDPMAIRAICEKTGRSYGNIHRILTDAKVTMRSRGYQKPSGTEEHRDDVE